MKLSDIPITKTENSKRKKRPSVNIIKNYKGKASLEHGKSVTKASLECGKSVTKASLERDKKISKKKEIKQSVTKASLERGPERDWVRDKSVTKASLERDKKNDISEATEQEELLLNFLYETCSSLGQRQTEKIPNRDAIKVLKTSSGSLRSLILRLKKKGFLNVLKTKNGPSGWRIYELPNFTYKHFSNKRHIQRASLKREESVTNASQRASLGASLTPSSSNSNILLNNTITTQPSKNYDWLQDIQTPENLKSLGFGVNHIKQLKEKFSLTPEQIQNGLEAFSFDLTQGELERLKTRGIQNIIGYFFGAMKSGGYNSVSDGFISAEDLAEKEMLERLERKQKERKERKEKLEALLFEEWLETKNKNEILEIERPVSGYLDIIHKAGLKDYFLKNEFDNFKKEVNV